MRVNTAGRTEMVHKGENESRWHRSTPADSAPQIAGNQTSSGSKRTGQRTGKTSTDYTAQTGLRLETETNKTYDGDSLE